MIDTIIFDIGNVLLDFDYMRVFRSLFDEETAQAISDISVRKTETWLELDRGVLSYDEAVDLVVQGAPQLEKEIRLAVKELFLQVESYPYATEWVRSLKEKGYGSTSCPTTGKYPLLPARRGCRFCPMWTDRSSLMRSGR